MNPVSLELLLSVCDGVESEQIGGELSKDNFRKIVGRVSQAKDLTRRAATVSHVLRLSKLLEATSENYLLTSVFQDFMRAWNTADFLALNACLSNYPPYQRFLRCLRNETALEIPAGDNKIAKQRLNQWLQENYQLTYVAFHTFRPWATALGVAYKSPFDNLLRWGGDWSVTAPLEEVFRQTLLDCYAETEQSSGYVNIGRLADKVCLRLRISFQAFEIKLNELTVNYPREFVFANATRRRFPAAYSALPTVRARLEIVEARTRAAMLDQNKQKIGWLENRFLEDGVRLNGQLVRLLRHLQNYDLERRHQAV